MKYDLSIIILSWNTKQLLQKCLESMTNDQWLMANTEIIVVDNNSQDGSVELARNFQFSNSNLQKKLILNKKNRGFAKGNNQGIKQAKGKYILLLNSDTEVKPGALKILVNYLKEHPKVSAVSPMLLNMDGSKQIDYYMKFPNFWQMIFYHNGILRPIAMHTPLKNLIINSQKNKPFAVDQLPGAALMARRQTFDQVGLLDEDFEFLFEDVDWCYRIKKAGNGKLMVIPEAEIKHVGGGSWKKHLDKNRFGFYKQYFKSLFKFVDKHYPQKKLALKLGLGISLLTNSLMHLTTLSFKKMITQLRLIRLIYDF